MSCHRRRPAKSKENGGTKRLLRYVAEMCHVHSVCQWMGWHAGMAGGSNSIHHMRVCKLDISPCLPIRRAIPQCWYDVVDLERDDLCRSAILLLPLQLRYDACNTYLESVHIACPQTTTSSVIMASCETSACPSMLTSLSFTASTVKP